MGFFLSIARWVMSYQIYGKPYKSPSDLVTHLANKGLVIADPQAAESLLGLISYYRFKIYLLPFIDGATGQYLQGTTIENGIDLYRFDDTLRDMLFSIIGRLEIKLRSRLDHVVAAHTQNPFWYLDDNLFSNEAAINRARAQFASSFQESKAEFSIHYKSRYYNDINPNFKQLPPFWVIAELATFGNIQAIYGAINKSHFNGMQNSNALDSLAHEFGAKNLKELNNWMKLIRDVRNRCAHHSRVWNCNYREPSTIRNLLSPQYPPAHQNRLYLFVALLHHIGKALRLDLNLKQDFISLFAHYPASNTKKGSAGFPDLWENDPFWN